MSFSFGSLVAHAAQIAPVPPRFGKRNVLFGPQDTSSSLVAMLRRTRLRSVTATRSPIQPALIISGGNAQTFLLYGSMNRLVMPAPKVVSIHCRKSLGSCDLPVPLMLR